MTIRIWSLVRKGLPVCSQYYKDCYLDPLTRPFFAPACKKKLSLKSCQVHIFIVTLCSNYFAVRKGEISGMACRRHILAVKFLTPAKQMSGWKRALFLHSPFRKAQRLQKGSAQKFQKKKKRKPDKDQTRIWNEKLPTFVGVCVWISVDQVIEASLSCSGLFLVLCKMISGKIYIY